MAKEFLKMIKSMTGYGLANHESDQYKVSVEVKSLNSKFLDLNLKLPKVFSEKELEIRKIVSDILERGKVSLSIEYLDSSLNAPKLALNTHLFIAYYNQLKSLANEVDANTTDLFKMALQSPDVVMSDTQTEGTAVNWESIRLKVVEALSHCDSFRMQEGDTLKKQIEESIRNIDAFLSQVIEQDPKRAETIRARLRQNIDELLLNGKIDENRLEQEIIYYIEKLDISEEKVRLKSHLDYFLEVMDLPTSQGKKLGFISQEIGREINTIGSKANDALIQKYVVGMKEELEKIKEQLLNIV